MSRKGHQYPIKLTICTGCGRAFETRQLNPTQLPKLCSNCRTKTHPCPVCGKAISYFKKYCDNRCAQRDISNEKIRIGHMKQGEKIKGDKNPMNKEENRRKVSDGVTRSYTPELRKLRGENWASLFSGKYPDTKGNLLRSKFELSVANKLQELGYDYEYEKRLKIEDKFLYPDFTLQHGTIIEVVGFLLNKRNIAGYKAKLRLILEATNYPLVVITYSDFVPVFENLNNIRSVDIVALNIKNPKLTTIRMDNVDVIDYAHTLPFHSGKCSAIHAHSSFIVSVELTGTTDPLNYMLLDFGDIKAIVKKVSQEFDHHLVIDSKYITLRSGESVTIEYNNSNGFHKLLLPESEVTALDGEATIENMAEIFASRLEEYLPPNIVQILVEISEGIGKSAIFCKSKNFEPKFNLDELDHVLKYHEKIMIRPD